MHTHDNLAYLIDQEHSPSDAFSQHRVTGIAGEWFLFNDSLKCGRAKVSASCLLYPEVGDQVLVFNGAPNAYILTILARGNPQQQATVRLPDHSELTCSSGPLTLSAHSLRFKSQREISLKSSELRIASDMTEIRSKQLYGWFALVDTKAINIKLIADQCSGVFGRLIHRARESFRWIEGTDETRAGRVRIRAQEHIQVTSKHTSIRAEGYVKIDGKKIDLG